jgi:NAD(P)-dependent dehydrogenase (short-subunit alcohol dehydrogenase family)
MELKNKVVIITGSGAGIGKSAAILFSAEGAKVICNSLSDSAKMVADEITKKGGNAIFIQGDVSNDANAKTIIDKTIKTFGQLDILVNNAGIVIPGNVDTTKIEDWDRTMAVNIRSVFLMSHYACPYLKESHGTIINISSTVALKGVKDRFAYTASKGAISAVTRAMAIDLVEDKIRVNAICPGTTNTPSLANRLSNFPDPQGAYIKFIARQPLGRFGTSEEIAEGILFLAKNEFCTGISLSIDGGMTI